jgi:hypothetical protein
MYLIDITKKIGIMTGHNHYHFVAPLNERVDMCEDI